MISRSTFDRVCFLAGLLFALLLNCSHFVRAQSATFQDSSAKPIVHFTDVAQKAGLTAPVIFGGENTKKYIIETTGTGVAIFDYDNDGWPDIFVVNGTTLDAASQKQKLTSHLYHN